MLNHVKLGALVVVLPIVIIVTIVVERGLQHMERKLLLVENAIVHFLRSCCNGTFEQEWIELEQSGSVELCFELLSMVIKFVHIVAV